MAYLNWCSLWYHYWPKSWLCEVVQKGSLCQNIIIPFVIVPNVIMPNVIVPNVIVPNVIVPNVIVPNVIMPNDIMPNDIMPNDIMPNNIIPNVIMSTKALIRDPYRSDILLLILRLYLFINSMLYQLSSRCFQCQIPNREAL
jgi:hypothetical protein